MEVNTMVENKYLREQYISRVEVLDKVKALFLIPQLDMVTARQIADFYEVDTNTIKLCYQRNKKEIDLDGTVVKIPQDFGKISIGTNCTFRKDGVVNILEYAAEDNKIQVVIPNRGVRCFSKRAVLRFGMLLRDSKIAQEVRTQLLNIVEHTDVENLTVEIDNELKLLEDAIGAAFSSGDIMKFAEATMKLNAYKDRHIKAANEKIHELTEENNAVKEDNKILSGNILEWSNRASANKVVRLMASELKWSFETTWAEVYNELLYKHNISLKTRKAKDGRKSLPLISFLRDDEWECLYATIAAMLEARYVNPSRIFEAAKVNVCP